MDCSLFPLQSAISVAPQWRKPVSILYDHLSEQDRVTVLLCLLIATITGEMIGIKLHSMTSLILLHTLLTTNTLSNSSL